MSTTISLETPLEQGQTLTEKAVDVHVIDGVEVLARWYHSPLEADLMVWFDAEGQPLRFQLNSSGQIVDWNEADGLQTGLIVELEVRLEVAETIQFDVSLNAGTVAVAKIVLENGLFLPKVTRGYMLERLAESSRPNRPRAAQSRSRFWGRFKRWTICA